MDMQKLLEKTKVNLKSLVKSSKKCVFLREVPCLYKKLTGEKLPYRQLGFSSPEKLYINIDGIYIHNTLQGPVLLAKSDKATAHLEKLVERQRDASNSMSCKAKPSRTMSRNAVRRSKPVLKTPDYPPRNEPVHQFQATQASRVPQHIVDAVRTITSDSPNGLDILTLQHLILKKFKIQVEPSQFLFRNWAEFMAEIPNVKFKFTEKGDRIYPVGCRPKIGKSPPVAQPKSKDGRITSNKDSVASNLNNVLENNSHTPNSQLLKETMEQKFKYSENTIVIPAHKKELKVCSSIGLKEEVDEYDSERLPVSYALLEKILQVVNSYSGGVYLNDFCTCYEEFHGQSIEIEDSPDGLSLEALFCSLKDYFILSRIGCNYKYVTLTSHGQRWLEEQLKLSLKFKSKKQLLSSKCKIAADAITSCHTVPPPPDFRGFKVDNYYNVVVCSIYSPDKFYLQLASELKVLDELTIEMNETYNNESLSKCYSIPLSMVKPGLSCAARQSAVQSWNRGFITSIDDEDVDVKFCDFGYNFTMHISTLKFLKEKFILLPFFSFQAQLSDIEGTSDKYSLDAVRRFIQLCLDKKITAKIEKAEAPLSVELFNECGNIKEILISEGHAKSTQLSKIKAEPSVQNATKTLDASRKSLSSSHDSQLFRESCVTSTTNSSLVDCTKVMNNLNLSSDSDRSYAEYKVRPVHQSDDSIFNLSNKSSHYCEAQVVRIPESSCCLMKVTLKNGVVHVIRRHQEYYIPTFEVSRFFWKVDILKQVVSALHQDVQFLNIYPNDQSNLFEKLQQVCDDPPTKKIELAPLKKLPDILSNVLKHKVEIVKEFVWLADIFAK